MLPDIFYVFFFFFHNVLVHVRFLRIKITKGLIFMACSSEWLNVDVLKIEILILGIFQGQKLNKVGLPVYGLNRVLVYGLAF